MNRNEEVVQKINAELSRSFDDYQGAYFYGSRAKGKFHEESDFDVVLMFDSIDHDKRMAIAGIVSDLEYHLDMFLDYKLFTTTGKKSIEYLRQNVNPVFIEHAIDRGIYYARV